MSTREHHEPPRLPGGRRLALVAGATVLVALGVGALIAKAAGFRHVRDAIDHADSTWFVVCFVAESRRSPPTRSCCGRRSAGRMGRARRSA